MEGSRRGFTGRVWGAGKLLVLLALLGVTFAVSFGMAMRLALRTRDVRVPDLRGRSVNQASTSLTEIGLPLKVEEARRSDPAVKAGLILAQEPVAGSTARRPSAKPRARCFARARPWLMIGTSCRCDGCGDTEKRIARPPISRSPE